MDLQKQMSMEGHTISQDKTVEFMLAEYSMLRDTRQSLISLGENRLNFFMAIVSGAVVGLALINQIQSHDEIIFFVNTGIIIGIFFIGLITFVRMVERSISIIVYTRAMNRIRRWFVEADSNIEAYLMMPINDDKPSFRSTGFSSKRSTLVGLSLVVAVINSIIASTGISIFASLVLGLQLNLVFLSGVIIFAVLLFIQNRYHIISIREAEKRTIVKFPSRK